MPVWLVRVERREARTVPVREHLGAAWGGSIGPAAEKSVNETVTQAELFPLASPVTQASLPLQIDTSAQRRAVSVAAEGAGARAAAQPSPKAAATQLPFT